VTESSVLPDVTLTLEEDVCCYTILDCCVVPRLAEKVTIAARIALC
jgi:hypothetical protein